MIITSFLLNFISVKLKKHILKLRQIVEDSAREREELEQLVAEQRVAIEKFRQKALRQHIEPATPNKEPNTPDIPKPNLMYPGQLHPQSLPQI
jgi:hypothetical protein